jgi:tRNA G10  N-methylase Trm11
MKRRDGEFEEQLIQMQLDGFKNLPAIGKHQELGVETMASRLSMVASVNINGRKVVPVQALLEGKKVEKAWNVKYLSHGWHRYIGRFPPHVIRSLLNGFRISQPCLVLDPFNGSGTTTVESKLMGIDAIGVDICPLSHLRARALI